MTEAIKIAFGIIGLLFFVFLAVIQVVTFEYGVLDAEYRNKEPDACVWPTTRISYITIGYPLGCWAGSVPGK